MNSTCSNNKEDSSGKESQLQDFPCLSKCPVTIAIGLVGGKWKILILWQLTNKTRRFGELQRLIPEANKKMLAQQLRELENDKLIWRKAYPEVPPRVEYSLTDLGKSLKPVIDTICAWGNSYLEKVQV